MEITIFQREAFINQAKFLISYHENITTSLKEDLETQEALLKKQKEDVLQSNEKV